MKKGFTLIELLAVIVILAIISLIAIPIIINIIDNAKSSANDRSAYLYLEGVNNAIARYQLNNPENELNNLECNIYDNGTYIAYLDFNVSQEVFDACYAAWYLGIRNHNFCCFRSNGSVGYSDNQVVDGGNRYAGEIVDPKEKTLV